jgi:DNA-binding SARP family transcriptional activator
VLVNESTPFQPTNDSAPMTRFKVLGALEIVNGHRVCTPTAPKSRQVLALLLLCANQVVHVDYLIEELWGEEPPKSAMTQAQTYIYQLRKVIQREKLETPGSRLLVTKAPGYLFRVEPAQVDVFVFQRLVWQGRKLLESGAVEAAAQVLRQALDMWAGPMLADVTPGRVLGAHVVRLEEQRLRALELRIQADMRLDLHRELIGELRSLVATHPLNEWFHGQLIIVLSRAGRRSEALQAYQNLRNTLQGELGIEPSPELRRLQHEVLTDGFPAAVISDDHQDLRVSGS